jgi:hypothetical protein
MLPECFLNASLMCRELLRRCAFQLVNDEPAHGRADIVMRRVGAVLARDAFAPQPGLGLRRMEEVRSQLFNSSSAALV